MPWCSLRNLPRIFLQHMEHEQHCHVHRTVCLTPCSAQPSTNFRKLIQAVRTCLQSPAASCASADADKQRKPVLPLTPRTL